MKHTNKRKISMILVLAMVLSVLPLNLITVHAANSSAAVQTQIDAAVAAQGKPDADVEEIDIHNKESAIGHLDVADLKVKYPKLEYINARNTNVTRITPAAGVVVLYDGTFVAGSGNSNLKTIVWGDSSSLSYDKTDGGRTEIAIDGLLNQLKVNQNNVLQGIPAGLIDTVAYEIDTTGSNPVTAPNQSIATGTLDLLGKGTHSLKLEITLEGMLAPLSVFDRALNILDVGYELTTTVPSPHVFYQNNTAEITFTMKDSAGAVKDIGTIGDYTFTVNPGGLTVNPPTQITDGQWKITIDIPSSAATVAYELKATNTLNSEEAKLDFSVSSLPSLGTVELYEQNDTPSAIVPAGPHDVTKPIYIRGGTDVASSDIDNVNVNGYINGTTFALRVSSADVDEMYVNAISCLDPSGKVVGKAFSEGGKTIIRLTAAPRVVPGGSNETGTIAISIPHGGGTQTINLDYEITPSTAQAYEIYQVSDSFAQTMPTAAQLLKAIEDNEYSKVKKAVRLVRNGENFDLDSSSENVELIENTSVYLVAMAQYGAGGSGKFYIVPDVVIMSWGYNNNLNPPFALTPSAFQKSTGLTGQIVSNFCGSTALKVTAANNAKNSEDKEYAYLGINDGQSGTYTRLFSEIKIRSKNIEGYVFTAMSAQPPANGKMDSTWQTNHDLSLKADSDRTIPIGGKAQYKIWVVYDNDDIELVDFTSAALTPGSTDVTAFTTNDPTTGALLTVQATTEGGTDDIRVGDRSTISIIDGAGNKGEIETILGHSLIKGLTYWVEIPEGIDAYEGVASRTSSTPLIKAPISKQDLGTSALEIPRGLEGKVWIVPEFANTQMYTGSDWSNYALTSGVALSSTSASGGSGVITAPGSGSNNSLIIKSGDVVNPIDDLITASFTVSSSSIAIGTNVYPVDPLLSGISADVPVKITAPVLEKMVVEQYDSATDSYTALPYITGDDLYEVTGNVGQEVKLRAKVIYSDGSSVDLLGSNSGTYQNGVYFMPRDTVNAFNTSGTITSPTSTSFAAGNNLELGVLYGHFMSENPASYSALVNSGGAPAWNNNKTNDQVIGILRGLTQGIGINAYKESGAAVTDDAIKATHLTKPGANTVVPGHFAVELQQKGTYLLAFNGSYSANGYADKTWVEDLDHPGKDLRIRVKVDEPKVEKIYLVGSGLSYDATNSAYVFDNTPVPGGGFKKFNVYPVVLDTSWYMINGDQTPLPARLTLSQVGGTSGINFMKKKDWALSQNTIGTWTRVNTTGLVISPKIDSDENLYLEVTVTGNIDVTSLADIVLTLNNPLTQQATPETHSYARNSNDEILPQPADPQKLTLYTTKDDLVQDIQITDPASGTNVALGDHIDFGVEYSMKNNVGSTRGLNDDEFPGHVDYVAGAADKLVVTADPGNPGSCTFTKASGSQELRFTPTALGEYKFYLTTTNTAGAEIPGQNMVRPVTFKVVPATLSAVTVYYGEKAAVPGLPGAASYLQEEGGGALLNATALGQKLVEMNQNAAGTTQVGVYDSNNQKIAEFTVNLNNCDEETTLIPTSSAAAPLTFVPNQVRGLQFKLEYKKQFSPFEVTKTEFFDVTSLTPAWTDDFLTLSGSKVTATVPTNPASTTLVGKYTVGDGTRQGTLYATMDINGGPVPTYTYRVREGSTTISSVNMTALGETKVLTLQSSTDGGSTWVSVNDYTVSSGNGNAVAATRIGADRTRITAIANTNATTITFNPLQGGNASITVTVDIPPVIPPVNPGTQYTVTYFGNGSDNDAAAPTDASNPYADNAPVTVLSPGSLTKAGENFVEWNTMANGMGMGYQPGDTFNINSNVTLYAQWSGGTILPPGQPANWKLLVNPAASGSVTATNQNNQVYGVGSTVEVVLNDTLQLQATAASSSYQFKNWTVSPVGSAILGDVTAESTTLTLVDDTLDLNITITANFKAVSSNGGGGGGGGSSAGTYTLTFETNGGKEISSVKKDAGKVINLKDYTTTKAGYTFAGWYKESGLTTKITSVTLNSNTTVYAKWEKSAATEEETPLGSTVDNTGISGLITDDHFAYIGGYTDGTIAPDRQMLRAEVAQMFYNLLSDKSMGSQKANFTDVKSEDWYEEAVKTLASKGIITGYEDGTFNPNGSITRAEFATMASRFGNLKSGNISFSDVPKSFWGYDAIANVYTRGWVNGYQDGTFMPNKVITRAEVIKITNNMLNRFADQSYINNNQSSIEQFTDLTKSHWAYYVIMEATRAHDFTSSNGVETWDNLK